LEINFQVRLSVDQKHFPYYITKMFQNQVIPSYLKHFFAKYPKKLSICKHFAPIFAADIECTVGSDPHSNSKEE